MIENVTEYFLMMKLFPAVPRHGDTIIIGKRIFQVRGEATFHPDRHLLFGQVTVYVDEEKLCPF